MNDSLRMTPGRVLTLTAGVPAALALIGWTGLNLVALAGQGSYQLSRTIPAVNHTVTANIDGDVLLRQASVPTAQVTGVVRYSLVRPAISQDADGSVEVDCRLAVGDCSFGSSLVVPREDRLSLSTGGGDLDTGDFTGDLTLNTVGGDITADALTGNLLRLSSGGGDFSANSVKGPLQLTCLGGDVNINALTAADADIDSGGGDVTVTLTDAPSGLTIDSLGGDIDLTLPDGSYDLSTSASGGDVTTDPRVTSDPHSDHVITVDSSGGDITISGASPSAP